jgi:hypothetical protein
VSGWNKVSTVAELDQFLVRVGSFHDGILKEVHWVNRDFIEVKLGMHAGRLSDAHVLVQRQYEDPSAVVLLLENVWGLGLDAVDFI